MTDLRERFRSLDSLEFPGIGEPSHNREDRGRGDRRFEPSEPRRVRQLVAAATAFVVAVGIFAVLSRSFSGKPEPHSSVTPGGVTSLPPGLGGSLIIASGVGPQAELYRYDLATATLTDLGPGAYPSVSPDGQRISFRTGYREHGLTAQQIAVMNIDGSGRRVLSIAPVYTNDVGGGAGPAVWSPDGTRLVFASRAGIYTARPDGLDLQPVTSAAEVGRVCADLQPSWSPDGRHLVFSVSCEGGDRGLWSVVVSSGSQRSLVTPGQEGIIAAYSPAWSPDGAFLAFAAFAQLEAPHRRTSNIFLRYPSGGLTQLTHCVNMICRSPVWSSDGRWVAFSRQSSVSGANPPAQLGVIRSDGSELSTLVRNVPADITALAWVPAPSGATPSATPTEVYFPPTFAGAAADGWHIRDSGFAKNGEGSTAWASATAFDPADISASAPAIPYNTIAALPAGGIVIVAEVTPWAFDPAKGPWPAPALQPLDLSQARLRGPVAEEPPGNYSVLDLDNPYTSVRVYFGVDAPSPGLIQQAQAELDRLRVPPACPTPAVGGYEASLSVDHGLPGDTVTISGPMPIQHEDGSFDQNGQTSIVAWWNAPPADWAALAPGATTPPSPAGPGPLVRLGEGGLGACSFSISFTVPQAPPGIYPIVPLEQNSGSATALPTLMFRITT